jgi:HAMP domain-containing protein
MVATMVIRHEGQVVEVLVLQEAQTAALLGAASVGSILDNAVDEYTSTCSKGEALSKDVECTGLSLSDILEPPYEEIKFFDKKTKLPLHVADKRFRNRLSAYVTAHGVEQLENAAKRSGNFLFATAMDRRGFVPRTHGDLCLDPRGDATPEDAAWDRIHSRCGRMYDGAEQIAAAGYIGNDKSPTLTQPYPRDTGEMAWDVAAPIYVKGQHFGGFRVGVARDRVMQQYHDLIVGLSMLFGLIAIVFVGVTMWLSYHYIKPLSVLSDRATELSMSGDPAVLDVRIRSTDPTEIGEMTRALDRIRSSLSAAMGRLDLP